MTQRQNFQIPRREYRRVYTASPTSQRYYNDVHMPYAYDPVFSTPDVYYSYRGLAEGAAASTDYSLRVAVVGNSHVRDVCDLIEAEKEEGTYKPIATVSPQVASITYHGVGGFDSR